MNLVSIISFSGITLSWIIGLSIFYFRYQKALLRELKNNENDRMEEIVKQHQEYRERQVEELLKLEEKRSK